MLKAEVSTVTDDPTIAPAAREHAGERAEPRPGTRSRRPWPRLEVPALREIILALALLFCYGFFRQVPAWNEYSRYDLVQALVQDGTTSIDRYHENTGDKAFYDGHYFSDKAPGTAFLGVPIYVLLALGSEAAGAGAPDPETAVHALAFGVSGVATALLVLLLLRFLRPTVGERWALVISLGYGFGSLAFPFGAMFFGHAASAFFLFASFYLLWRWRADGRAWRPLLAGFLAGWAVITEIPVVLGVAVLGGYALWLGRGHALRFVAGGIPVALVFAAYNWISFGGPFDIGYQYATLFGEQNRQGIVSIVWPSWATAAELLVGPRGLLRLAPWFLLAPLGMLAYRRRAVRAEVVVSVAVCVVFLVYNSGALNPLRGVDARPTLPSPGAPLRRGARRPGAHRAPAAHHRSHRDRNRPHLRRHVNDGERPRAVRRPTLRALAAAPIQRRHRRHDRVDAMGPPRDPAPRRPRPGSNRGRGRAPRHVSVGHRGPSYRGPRRLLDGPAHRGLRRARCALARHRPCCGGVGHATGGICHDG